jgi:hypothetical protein
MKRKYVPMVKEASKKRKVAKACNPFDCMVSLII